MNQTSPFTTKLKLKFWSMQIDELFKHLEVTPEGLSDSEARERLDRYGPNLLRAKKKSDPLVLLVNQFKSPIILLLIFAAMLSFFLGETTDALIIVAIVQIKTTVLRDGYNQEIPVEEVVPGDIAIFRAGDVIPGDCRILSSKDLFVNEATLTGETYPVEKLAGGEPLLETTVLSKRVDGATVRGG